MGLAPRVPRTLFLGRRVVQAAGRGDVRGGSERRDVEAAPPVALRAFGRSRGLRELHAALALDGGALLALPAPGRADRAARPTGRAASPLDAPLHGIIRGVAAAAIPYAARYRPLERNIYAAPAASPPPQNIHAASAASPPPRLRGTRGVAASTATRHPRRRRLHGISTRHPRRRRLHGTSTRHPRRRGLHGISTRHPRRRRLDGISTRHPRRRRLDGISTRHPRRRRDPPPTAPHHPWTPFERTTAQSDAAKNDRRRY